MAFCANCGSPIQDGIKFCGRCGKAVTGVANEYAAPTQSTQAYPPGYVPKNWLTALLLCIFLGFAHRFYVGKIGTGILMLLLGIIGWTGFGFFPLLIFFVGYFIWWLIDLINICTGKFTDGRGFVLKKD